MQQHSAQPRVVVVDDEPAIADSLAAILKRHGAEVIACYDPRQALIAGDVLNPHVLISDIVMPSMDGFQVARFYAENYPGCKVLLLSGNVTPASLAREADATRPFPQVLEKPVHPSAILAFVDSCVAAG